MRVALLAPITHPIPPRGYGPWERIVAHLANGLTAEGHDATLFAPAGAETRAKLITTVPHPLATWPPGETVDPRIWEEVHIASVAEIVSSGGFDVLHSHLSVHPLGYAHFLPVPIVTTLHGVAWNRAVHPALNRYRHLPYVSLSSAERGLFPGLNYVATVFNAVDCDHFRPGQGEHGFLLFAGRMAPEKQPHLAIEVATRTGIPIRLAGMIEAKHREYFTTKVAPRIGDSGVEYLGDVDDDTMAELYSRARAVIVPLGWDEPFGLVIAESLASGTPVVAWHRGAVPELVRDGITGFVVDDSNGAVAALGRLDELDRAECRRDAEERFSVAAMTRGYLDAYQRVSEAG